MTISMHAASVPVFTETLTALSGILSRAADHAAAKKIEPSVLLGLRLAPDMFPLTRQVQIASDFAKGTCARLAGVEVPSWPDDETTIEGLKARIERTIAFVGSLPAAAIDGSEARDITLKAGGQTMTFKGQPYLLHFALPNFFFHATAAYAILRAAGVDIGKADFLNRRTS